VYERRRNGALCRLRRWRWLRDGSSVMPQIDWRCWPRRDRATRREEAGLLFRIGGAINAWRSRLADGYRCSLDERWLRRLGRCLLGGRLDACGRLRRPARTEGKEQRFRFEVLAQCSLLARARLSPRVGGLRGPAGNRAKSEIIRDTRPVVLKPQCIPRELFCADAAIPAVRCQQDILACIAYADKYYTRYVNCPCWPPHSSAFAPRCNHDDSPGALPVCPPR
jgi:hypothetical protein